MEIKIEAAVKTDAPFIADTVMGALGEDLCVGLAEGEINLPKVRELFTRLALSADSQYSYLNTLIARTPGGASAGAIIVYDGARLHRLRPAFIHEANNLLGWNVTQEEAEKWEDETGPDQIYLDSIYVRPEFRGQGVGSALIAAAMEAHSDAGKPFGLLVEPENSNARRLYESLGFRHKGINRFCGVPMHHLQSY